MITWNKPRSFRANQKTSFRIFGTCANGTFLSSLSLLIPKPCLRRGGWFLPLCDRPGHGSARLLAIFRRKLCVANACKRSQRVLTLAFAKLPHRAARPLPPHGQAPSDAFDHREHKIGASPLDLFTLGPGIGELREKAVQEVQVPCTDRLHQKDLADGKLQWSGAIFVTPSPLRDLSGAAQAAPASSGPDKPSKAARSRGVG
jgi:hypothetical protein